MPYQDALVLASKYGGSLTEIANRQNIVSQLYAGKTSNFDVWIAKQPEPTQQAWSEAVLAVKGKYGNAEGDYPGYAEPVKYADAVVNGLKTEAINKTPEQIRKLVEDRLKTVTTTPRYWFFSKAPMPSFFDKKEEGWKVRAGM